MSACEAEQPAAKAEDKKAEDKKAEEPSRRAAALDPKIAAVASAAAGAPQGSAPANEGGPPENGILDPDKAASEAGPGAWPKVALGSDGKAPRIALRGGAPLPPQVAETASIQVILQADPNAGALPIDVDVAFQFSKPKTQEPAKIQAEDAKAKPAAASAGAELRTVVQVRGVKVALAAGSGAEEINKKLGKLKGTTITFDLDAQGGATGFGLELAKGADPDVADVVRTLAEGLRTLMLPYPDKPVGEDAYWMVTNRESAMGLDVVSYRMVKLTKLSGQQATLSVSAKRYVVGSRFEVPGVAAGGPMEIERFEGASEGTVEVATGRALPLSGQANSMLSAMLKPNSIYQSQSGIRLTFAASGAAVGGPTVGRAAPAGITPNTPATKPPSAP